MHKPYKFTLTPADRIIFEKWLRGAVIFYGSLALLIFGIAGASHYLGLTPKTASTSASAIAPGQDVQRDAVARTNGLVRSERFGPQRSGKHLGYSEDY